MFGSSKRTESTETVDSSQSNKLNSSSAANMSFVPIQTDGEITESEENVNCSVPSNMAQYISNDEDMTNLVKLQSSNGVFEMRKEKWEKTVLEKYLGTFEDVKSSCPDGIELNIWITALAIKILEVSMKDKTELWELVAEKSKKYTLKEMENNEEKYKNLQDKAEQYVTKQITHKVHELV